MSELATVETGPDPTGDPWDQRPGEPDDAYMLFTRYRDMPARSLGELAELTAHTKTALRRLYRMWDWRRRAQAYDTWRRHQWAAEQEAGRERAGRMAGQLGEAMLARAGAAAMQTDPAELTPRDIATWTTAGLRAAEQGWGTPGDRPTTEPESLGLGSYPHAAELTDDDRDRAQRRALDLLTGQATRMATDPTRPPDQRLRAVQAGVTSIKAARDGRQGADTDDAEPVDAEVQRYAAHVADALADAPDDVQRRVLAALDGGTGE